MLRLAFAATLALTVPASAQTVLGVTLGAPIPEGLPPPAGTQTQPPFAQTYWPDIDGVSMSVVGDIETGEVLFIELRPASDGPVSAQIDGIFFGETTRDAVQSRFGSEGIVYADVGRTRPVGELAVHFTNYEIADSDVVISFTTIQPLSTASEETAGQSVLDSVVITQDTYISTFWGINRGRLPGYAPIADPFIP